MSATEWRPQLEALRDRYEVIAYDVRGHGRTGGSDVDAYDVDLFAKDLHELLDALDVANPVVVGHSMGGAIAQVYAVTYPDRVAGVVLLDTFSTTDIGRQGRAMFATLRLVGWLDRFVRYKTLNRWQLRVYERLSPGAAGGGGDHIQALMDADPTISHREVRKLARAVAAFPGSAFDPGDVTVPALVCYGEHVPGAMRDMATGLAEDLDPTTTTVTVVPDGGHAAHLDNPSVVVDAIRTFLDGLPGHERH
jgi:pimeloyl-ACP methyl ester carboxylesterase